MVENVEVFLEQEKNNFFRFDEDLLNKHDLSSPSYSASSYVSFPFVLEIFVLSFFLFSTGCLRYDSS